MENLKDILAGCFEGLEEAEIEALSQDLYGAFDEVSYKAHDVVFKDGDESRELYIILDGKVKISKEIGDGGVKILAVLEKGSVFGEGSLLSGKTRGASAQAVTDIKVLKLDYEDFEKLQMDSPAATTRLLMGIVKILNQRLQYVNLELITLYEVNRILASAPDDLSMVTGDVLGKFSEVANCEQGAIFLHNAATEKEDMLAVSGESGAEFVAEITGEVVEVAKFFQENTAERYKNDEGVLLWLPIRNYQGKFLGVVVLKNSEGKFNKSEVKLALAIADQLGVAVERHYKTEDDLEKVKLKQEMVGL